MSSKRKDLFTTPTKGKGKTSKSKNAVKTTRGSTTRGSTSSTTRGSTSTTRGSTSKKIQEKTNTTKGETQGKSSRPSFQFKIGLEVGVALGDCFLQLQRLESGMVRLQGVSEEIGDFMSFLQDQFQVPTDNPWDVITDEGETVPKPKAKKTNSNTMQTKRTGKHKSNLSTSCVSESMSARSKHFTSTGKLKNQNSKRERSKTRGVLSPGHRSVRSYSPQPSRVIPQQSPNTPGAKLVIDVVTPFDNVITLNETLELTQRDCGKRMTSLMKALNTLKTKLEELDEHHSSAEQERQLVGKQEINFATQRIEHLQQDLDKTRVEVSEKNFELAKLRRESKDVRKKMIEQQKVLDSREEQLDQDAEAIAAQSEHLRADTERLLSEKDEVRRQKERWNKMITEQKSQKDRLIRRDLELNESQKQLITLQKTLAEKESHLHRKAKKLRSRERRIQQALMEIRPASSFGGGTDYAPSELTYFSDGETEIASVNSLSEDEIDAVNKFSALQQT